MTFRVLGDLVNHIRRHGENRGPITRQRATSGRPPHGRNRGHITRQPVTLRRQPITDTNQVQQQANRQQENRSESSSDELVAQDGDSSSEDSENTDGSRSKRATHGGKDFSCKLCSKIFLYEDQLLNHNRLHQDSEVRGRGRFHNKLYRCPDCYRGFNRMYYFNKHRCSAKKKQTKTQIQNNQNTRVKNRTTAEKETTEAPALFKCTVCSAKFNRKYDLLVHGTRHRMKSRFKCTTCDRSFQSRMRLIIHKYSHRHGPDRVRFTSLTEHQSRLLNCFESKPSQFKCLDCSLEFSKMSHLQRHRQNPDICQRVAAMVARKSGVSLNDGKVTQNGGNSVIHKDCITQNVDHILPPTPPVYPQISGKFCCYTPSGKSGQCPSDSENLTLHRCSPESACKVSTFSGSDTKTLLCHKELQLADGHAQNGSNKDRCSMTPAKPEIVTFSKLDTLSSDHKEPFRLSISDVWYICSMCKLPFSSAVGLQNHLTLHGGEPLYHCYVCNRTFPSKFDLINHAVDHRV